MFIHENLKYQNVINLCFGKQETNELQTHVSNVQTWTICKISFEIMYFQPNLKVLATF
jgi:hypothetical protein